MSDWVLVPCLVTLRDEFDAIAPGRDKGADGSIGDSAHTSASDHTPDEDSDVLRTRDADSKNEVHALDIDSTGPWPGSVTDFSAFNLMVRGIVDRHRSGEDNRLQYVIWNRQIANRDIDNWRWRPYTATDDPHTNHAHFSARYTTAQESDTNPWGIDMALTAEDRAFIAGASEAGVIAVLAEAYRAAQGKAPAATIEDRRARNVRDYLRTIVGGPTDISGIPAATAAQVLEALGSAQATPAQIAAILAPVLGVNAAPVGRALAGLA